MRKLFISKATLERSLHMIRKSLGAHTTLEMLHLLRTRKENADTTVRFSPRGKAVFLLLMEGLTHKRISERLGMGVNGVKRHKEKMLLQNDCGTMLELIAKYHGTYSG